MILRDGIHHHIHEEKECWRRAGDARRAICVNRKSYS